MIQSPTGRGRGLGGPEAATVPPRLSNRAAIGKSCPGSPAQRMTTASNRPSSSSMTSSTRPLTTRTFSSASSRTALERNETRFWRDSTRTSSTSPSTILSGIPGRPAPAPRSSSVLGGEGNTLRNSRLSRKRFSTIQWGAAEPMSRCDFFHLISNSRYLQKSPRSRSVSARPRISCVPSAKLSSGSVTCLDRRSRRRIRPGRRLWPRAQRARAPGGSSTIAGRSVGYSTPSSRGRALTEGSET